jgi:Aspartyl protease
MKFVLRDGLIWLPISLIYEGALVEIENCILDTGSATTAIDIDLVTFNYRKPTAIKRLYGLGGGTQEVVSQQIDSLTIDGQTLQAIDIEFGDMQADFGINGFVGNDVLSRFTVTIDFRKQEIHLTVEP